MNPRRLRIGEWITGFAGVALLGVMFLGWYDVNHTETYQSPGYAGVRTVFGSVTAWEAFTVVDVLLAIVAAMAIGTAVMAAAHNTPAVSLAIASLLLTVGFVTLIVLLIRVLAVPDLSVEGVTVPDDAVDRALGLWLGLGATALATVGALATMRDERFPQAARIEVPIETLPPPEGGTA